MSVENIIAPKTSDYKLNPELLFLALKQKENLMEAVWSKIKLHMIMEK